MASLLLPKHQHVPDKYGLGGVGYSLNTSNKDLTLSSNTDNIIEHDDMILSSIAAISHYPRKNEYQKRISQIDASQNDEHQINENCHLSNSFDQQNFEKLPREDGFDETNIIYPLITNNGVSTDKLLFNYLSNYNELQPNSFCVFNLENGCHYQNHNNVSSFTWEHETVPFKDNRQCSSILLDQASLSTSQQSLQSDTSLSIDKESNHQTLQISVNASINYEANSPENNYLVNDKRLIVATIESQARKTFFHLAASNSDNTNFFWKYNVQSKGPKIMKSLINSTTNPINLNILKDPICQFKRYHQNLRQSSKIRKNDCNDMTPNAKRLLELGQAISLLTSTSKSLVLSDKYTQRKEKNRLASRSCRLKKKAQHEAFKLKLYGLNAEHSLLIDLIDKIRNAINNFDYNEKQHGLCKYFDELMKEFYGEDCQVAGNLDAYVCIVLQRISSEHNFLFPDTTFQ